MFIGHFAVGLAAKRAAPRASLGALMAAPILLDLLWPIFLLLGWERVRIQPGVTAFNDLALEHYPWSHSLLMSVVWAAAFAGVYWLRTGYRAGALAIAAGVVSHWVLDWITHRPDLPLYPGSSPLYGLGLWNAPAATIAVESLMFGGAVWLYARTTRSLDLVGRFAFWAFVGLLALGYAVDALSTAPSPPPRALAWGALTGWLLPILAWWFDRHRQAVDRGLISRENG
jgi:membrane-bound metal-dependent hydrolase YbcI (DUF457 family)